MNYQWCNSYPVSFLQIAVNLHHMLWVGWSRHSSIEHEPSSLISIELILLIRFLLTSVRNWTGNGYESFDNDSLKPLLKILDNAVTTSGVGSGSTKKVYHVTKTFTNSFFHTTKPLHGTSSLLSTMIHEQLITLASNFPVSAVKSNFH